MFGSGREASRMSVSGWEALSDVREWSGGPHGYPGVVRRPCRLSGSGQEALLDVRELSGGPAECPRVGRRPS